MIGASAGGVEALKAVASRLPGDLPAAICVVLHIAPTSTSALAGILGRAGDLPCRPAEDGEELRPGHILVASPDHHLVVEDGDRPRDGRPAGEQPPPLDRRALPVRRAGARPRGGRASCCPGPGTTARRAWPSSSPTAAPPSCRTPRTRSTPGCRPTPSPTSPSTPSRPPRSSRTRSPRSSTARRFPTTCVPAIRRSAPPAEEQRAHPRVPGVRRRPVRAPRGGRPAVALPRRAPLLVRQPRRGAGRRRRGGAVDRAAQPGGPGRAHAAPRRAQRAARTTALRRRCSATRPSTPSARPTSCAPSCAMPPPRRSAQWVIRHDRGAQRDDARRPARLREAHPRLRLHGLQALHDRAPRREAHGGARARRATTTTSTTSSSTPRSSRRSSTRSSSTSRASSATRRPGITWRTRWSRSCSRRGRRTPPIRVWSAGCASGEEAYTVAMVFAKALGESAFLDRVKIYATDVDEEALDTARHGTYAARARRGRAARRARALLRALRPALHVPPRPAACGDLRPQRPRAGRPDLADRPARLPQHAHVLQRGDAVADPAPVPLRARRRRHARAGQVGDAHHARRPVPPDGHQAADLPQGRPPDDARPRPRHGDRSRERAVDGHGRRAARERVRRSRAARRWSSAATGRSRMANDRARRMLGLTRQGHRPATSTTWISPTAPSSCARASSGSPRTASRSRWRG